MFNDIANEISKLTEARTAAPTPTGVATAVVGTIISVPGTERVVLSTSVADFIVCEAAGIRSKAKQRYLIAHKDQPLKYAGQFSDSLGRPISIVPKVAFDTIVAIINSTGKQLQEMRRDLDVAKIRCESYEMTLNALRKNGVID